MSHATWPANHAGFAKIGSDLIVLDTATDRYSLLSDVGDLIDIGADGALVAEAADALTPLRDAGWLVDHPPPHFRRPRAATSAYVPSISRPDLRTIATVGAANASAKRAIPKRPLRDLMLRSAGDHPVADAGSLSRSLQAQLDRFETARPWVWDLGACLQRSLALRLWLHRRGHRTDWMFGVRTWPFSAHCWLQVGEVVVGDDLDRVRRYTPLFQA